MQFLARSSFANAASAGDASGSPELAIHIDTAIVTAIGLGLLIGLIAPRCGRPS